MGAAYLALALVVTWPAAIRPARALIGHPGGDQWPNLWGYHWVRDELLAGRFPLEIRQLGHPQGGTLLFLDMLDALLAMPLLGLLGTVATYNLLVWGNLVFAGLAAALLVGHLTRSRGAAFLGGLIYGFSPYLLGALANGVTETFTVGWIPLGLYLLLRVGETGRWRLAAGAGLCLGLTALACLYHGYLAGLACALVVVHGLTLRRPRWPLARLSRLALVAVVAAAFVGPLYLALRASRDPATSVNWDRVPLAFHGSVPLWRTRSMVLDPVNLLLPGKPAPPEDGGTNVVIHVTYLGWVVLAGVVLGVIPGRRRSSDGDGARAPPLADGRERALWIAGLVLFVVLALGRYLQLAGEPVTLFGRILLMPGALLDAVLSFAAAGEFKYRYLAAGTLFAAVLAGWGWARAAARLPARARLAALAGVALALLAETWLLSAARLPIPTADGRPPAYHVALAADPEVDAIFDLPVSPQVGIFGRFIYLSTVHGKAVPYIFERSMPDTVRQAAAVNALVGWSDALAGTADPSDLGAFPVEPLAEWGYDRLVVHRSIASAMAVDEGALASAMERLAGRYGPPVAEDDEVIVFAISP